MGASLRYNSFMMNIDKIFVTPFFENFIPGISESREKLNNGDLIIDSRIIINLTESSSISLIANNLLNREYQSRPANLMAPRNLSVKFGIDI